MKKMIFLDYVLAMFVGIFIGVVLIAPKDEEPSESKPLMVKIFGEPKPCECDESFCEEK